MRNNRVPCKAFYKMRELFKNINFAKFIVISFKERYAGKLVNYYPMNEDVKVEMLVNKIPITLILKYDDINYGRITVTKMYDRKTKNTTAKCLNS